MAGQTAESAARQPTRRRDGAPKGATCSPMSTCKTRKVAPVGAPSPSIAEGARTCPPKPAAKAEDEGLPRADQRIGVMTHACCLTIEEG